MQLGKLYIEDSVQGLELKMKRELDQTIKEQIAICENVEMRTDVFINRITILKNKINHLKGLRVSRRSKLYITKGFTSNLGTLWFDVYQSIRDCKISEPKSTNALQAYSISLERCRLKRIQCQGMLSFPVAEFETGRPKRSRPFAFQKK